MATFHFDPIAAQRLARAYELRQSRKRKAREHRANRNKQRGLDAMVERLKFHFEPGADGKPQAVLPGAERVSEAQLMRLRALGPMRPKNPQKPCDVGLFSDEADQLDLVEMFMDPAED